MPETANDVIIYHPDSLHEGIADAGSNEVEPPPRQVFAHRVGQCTSRRQLGQRSPRILPGLIIDITPDEGVKGAELFSDGEDSACIPNGRLNLQAMPHDAGVCKQALNIRA